MKGHLVKDAAAALSDEQRRQLTICASRLRVLPAVGPDARTYERFADDFAACAEAHGIENHWGIVFPSQDPNTGETSVCLVYSLASGHTISIWPSMFDLLTQAESADQLAALFAQVREIAEAHAGAARAAERAPKER